ncbi:hypothetical protein BDR03DRAFT_144246 [Suillus americanus]|nr:hypothetical protein BDR03DRAFT_144246 [Suillus americanus]
MPSQANTRWTSRSLKVNWWLAFRPSKVGLHSTTSNRLANFNHTVVCCININVVGKGKPCGFLRAAGGSCSDSEFSCTGGKSYFPNHLA